MQLAALPRLYDLIDWHPDGWRWGSQELTHPWFRILKWVGALPASLDALLSPLQPAILNGTPTTIFQFRGSYLNMTSPLLATWWGDNARAVPSLVMPIATATVASLTITRAPIAAQQVVGQGPALSIGP